MSGPQQNKNNGGRWSNITERQWGVIGAATAATAAASLWAGATFFDSKSSQTSASQPEAIRANEPLKSNLILSQADAFEKMRRGEFEPAVTEFAGTEGFFEYGFTRIGGSKHEPVDRRLLRAVPIAERHAFIQQLSEAGGIVSYEPSVSNKSVERFLHTASTGLSLVIASVVAYYGYGIYRHYRSQRPGPRPNLLKNLGADRPFERFEDVGGLDHVIVDFRDLQADIRAFKTGNTSFTLPRGFLVVGEPGVGKTLVSRCVAGETDCLFWPVMSGEVVSGGIIGQWAKDLLGIFEKARELRDQETKRLRSLPGATGQELGVVFLMLDEFEAIGRKRGDGSGSMVMDHQHTGMMDTLLAEMDNIDPERNRGIIVWAATNLEDVLDPALLRPGRFSKRIHVPLPVTMTQRLDILQRLSRRVVEGAGFSFKNKDDLRYVAKITAGRSGDYLRGILVEATSIARREQRIELDAQDLFEAFQRIMFGRLMELEVGQNKRELVAYHEIGHGYAGIACDREPFVISMKARGGSLGRVILDPQAFAEPPQTRADILRTIFIMAAGRAGERASGGLDRQSIGVEQDFKIARELSQQLLGSGMIDTHYALAAHHCHTQELPDTYLEALDTIIHNAISYNEELLKIVGQDNLKALVSESLTLDRELVGEEAACFLRQKLDEEKVKRMQQLAAEFITNPMTSPQAKTEQA